MASLRNACVPRGAMEIIVGSALTKWGIATLHNDSLHGGRAQHLQVCHIAELGRKGARDLVVAEITAGEGLPVE